MSTQVDGDFKISYYAVGIDRNNAAKPAERPGGRWCMSKLLPSGVAKGHCGRRITTFELPVHLSGK